MGEKIGTNLGRGAPLVVVMGDRGHVTTPGATKEKKRWREKEKDLGGKTWSESISLVDGCLALEII